MKTAKQSQHEQKRFETVWFVGCILMVYMTIAGIVFAFRHPWATETEKLIYFWDAMTFRRVPYREARPRE